MAIETLDLKQWDGNTATLNPTNLKNYKAVQGVFNKLNAYADVLPYFSHYLVQLDVSAKSENNRAAYKQFIDNAQMINAILPRLVKNSRFKDFAYKLALPEIPFNVDFDKDKINRYWAMVGAALNWCIEESNQLINGANINIPDIPASGGEIGANGIALTAFYNDKSTYKPGDTAQILFDIKNKNNNLVQFNYTLVAQPPLGNVINIKSGVITMQPNATYNGSQTWQLPYNDRQGYVLILTVTDINNDPIFVGTSAIDSVSSWTESPRYAALTNFTPEDQTQNENITNDIATLNKFHINATMYYDAYFRPQNPLPDGGYNDWLGNPISTDIVKQGITTNHKYGQASMLYNMINATTGTPDDDNSNMKPYPDLFGNTIIRKDGTKGVASKMGIFRTGKVVTSVPANTFDDVGEQATFNMLGAFNDRDDADHKIQYYYNPASADWQNYIGNIMINTINKYQFDGWQGDTIGNIYGTTYENRGQTSGFNTADSYGYFIDKVKGNVFGGKTLGMNTVNYTGQNTINSSRADFNYSELWQSDYPTYQNLADCIENVNNNSNNPLIVPSYMYRDWYQSGSSDLPSKFKDEAILMKDVVIFSHGGAPMELADNGYQLPTEYYPDTRKHYKIMMNDSLGNPDTGKLRKLYDFATAYSSVLYGFQETTGRTEAYSNVGADIGSKTVQANKLCVFPKTNGKVITLNVLNFLDCDNVNWQINNQNDEASKCYREKINYKVRYYTNSNVNQVCVASFENGTTRQFINVNHGENQYGKYIDIVMPSLKLWNLIYFEN